MSTLTDVGNAERFVSLHGETALYCKKMGSWYLWNGKYWKLDEKEAYILLAVQTAKGILEEAGRQKDIGESLKLTDWCKKSLQRNRLTSMTSLAQAHLAISPEEFDTNPWLLNVDNGTIDLKTGRLLPHSPVHRITKNAPVVFDAKAACPLWEGTVDRLLGSNQDLIRYMQKVIGYSLAGVTKEKCFFILHGSGDNGKTLFINAIMHVLGDYASSTTMETFTVTLPGAASNDVMRLKGARLAMASEAEKQFCLAEAKIKRITGGDLYTARLLYKEPIDFYPEFKIFLLTNQIPRFNVTDTALMSRIHLIPFEVTIPKEEQDKDLLEKLKHEASGILNWAIVGLLLWQQEGLVPPSSVVNALEDHRLEVDVLARFLEECCVSEPGSKVGVTRLHEAYTAWSDSNDLDAMGLKTFNTSLVSRGYKKARNNKGSSWLDIALNDPSVDNAEADVGGAVV